MLKRSFSIEGHRTSVALEPEFWKVLEEMAAASGQSLSGLVAGIDSSRSVDNLASACRLSVLSWLQQRRGSTG